MAYVKSFFVLLQFLTRVPLPYTIDCDEKTFERGLYSFTLVGLVLGLVFVGAANFLMPFIGDNWGLAVILVALHVFMTGGLHLDGVADAADGLLSNRSPERMLEIMKDSRIGSNGVLALMLVLSLKVVALKLVLDFSWSANVWWPLLLMPALGRFAVVVAAWRGRPVRSAGMGNLFIGKGTLPMLAFNGLVILAFFAVFEGVFVALGVALIVTLWLIWRVKGLIGGITGDVLGAIIELNELTYLMTLLVLLKLGVNL